MASGSAEGGSRPGFLSEPAVCAGARQTAWRAEKIRLWERFFSRRVIAPEWRLVMEKTDKIYVAGHRGLVGSAIMRNLKKRGYENIIGRTHRELDLTDQRAVRDFFDKERPEVVVLAAAKVGGINANNTAPAQFAWENMQIQCNVIGCCHDYGVKKLLFLGSTCIYPRMAPQPIPEDALLTGPLEETNEAYAIAKIAGLEMCKFYKRQYGDDFISCMPTNLYGPHGIS